MPLIKKNYGTVIHFTCIIIWYIIQDTILNSNWESFTFLKLLSMEVGNLVLMIVFYIVGLSIEFGFAVYRGHEVNEGFGYRPLNTNDNAC